MWKIAGTFLVNWRMSCVSKFSSHVTMISNFFIVNEFFRNPLSIIWFKFFFSFFNLDQIFVKVIFHYFFTVFILLKNCFNNFISSILSCKNNYSLGKFIIKTNKLVSKTTRNVVLILFWVRTFITFNTLSIELKSRINFKMELVFV